MRSGMMMGHPCGMGGFFGDQGYQPDVRVDLIWDHIEWYPQSPLHDKAWQAVQLYLQFGKGKKKLKKIATEVAKERELFRKPFSDWEEIHWVNTNGGRVREGNKACWRPVPFKTKDSVYKTTSAEELVLLLARLEGSEYTTKYFVRETDSGIPVVEEDLHNTFIIPIISYDDVPLKKMAEISEEVGRYGRGRWYGFFEAIKKHAKGEKLLVNPGNGGTVVEIVDEATGLYVLWTRDRSNYTEVKVRICGWNFDKEKIKTFEELKRI